MRPAALAWPIDHPLLFQILGLVFVAAALATQSVQPLNHDSAWYLVAARAWLDGAGHLLYALVHLAGAIEEIRLLLATGASRIGGEDNAAAAASNVFHASPGRRFTTNVAFAPHPLDDAAWHAALRMAPGDPAPVRPKNWRRVRWS